MRIELTSRGLELTDELRAHVERRLGYAVGRFGHRIARVQVRLTDINGPRGGEDIHCRVQTHLARGGSVIVDELQAGPFSAVGRAMDRVGPSVGRWIERRRAAFRPRRDRRPRRA